MSFGAGTFTLTRAQVLAKTGSLDLKQIQAKLKENAISPIAMDESTEESVGWCHPHTGEPEFSDFSEWVHDNSLIFGLRIDQKKVPGTLFKLQLRNLLEELERVESRKVGKSSSVEADRDFGQSRKMKDLARDRVKSELLKRTLPSIKLVEVLWNLQTGELWLTSTAGAIFETFDELFVKSFGLPYVMKTPGTLGIDFDRALLPQSHAVGEDHFELMLERLTQCVPWGAMGQAIDLVQPIHLESLESGKALPKINDEVSDPF